MHVPVNPSAMGKSAFELLEACQRYSQWLGAACLSKQTLKQKCASYMNEINQGRYAGKPKEVL
jgi:hypothetical protein